MLRGRGSEGRQVSLPWGQRSTGSTDTRTFQRQGYSPVTGHQPFEALTCSITTASRDVVCGIECSSNVELFRVLRYRGSGYRVLGKCGHPDSIQFPMTPNPHRNLQSHRNARNGFSNQRARSRALYQRRTPDPQERLVRRSGRRDTAGASRYLCLVASRKISRRDGKQVHPRRVRPHLEESPRGHESVPSRKRCKSPRRW